MAPEHFTALIDTGAQRTCVSQKLVSSLGLIPDAKTQMKSATAVVEVNQYQVGIFIPITKQTLVGLEQFKFGSPNTIVMEFQSSDKFDVIIGMDMLAECNLFLAHGEFVLSF
ncbi:MAG: retroviral-like aspartic protease family protein [Salinispira sp.]